MQNRCLAHHFSNLEADLDADGASLEPYLTRLDFLLQFFGLSGHISGYIRISQNGTKRNRYMAFKNLFLFVSK